MADIRAVFFDWNGTCSDLRAMTPQMRQRFDLRGNYVAMHRRLDWEVVSALVEARPWLDVDCLKRWETTTVCLTNCSRRMIERMGIDELFTVIHSSDDSLCYKPDRRMYLDAAYRLGLSPVECLMVAAHNFDLNAAASLGMHTAFVQRPGEDEKADGHATIETFKELPAFAGFEVRDD
jgi:HAD superfamily hydrolase (TIGR01493 family)